MGLRSLGMTPGALAGQLGKSLNLHVTMEKGVGAIFSGSA